MHAITFTAYLIILNFSFNTLKPGARNIIPEYFYGERRAILKQIVPP